MIPSPSRSNFGAYFFIFLLSYLCKSMHLLHILFTLYLWLLPAALRAAQACRYLIYSEADFEVFRPAGATRCTDRGEIWHGLRAKFHRPCQISPPSVQRQGCRTPKLKFVLRFDQNVEYKRPAGVYPLRDFHKIYRVCIAFQDVLSIKFGWICSRGYGVMEVLS